MAEEVEAPRLETPPDLSPERIQEILELNQTLDDMVGMIVQTMQPAIEVLPNLMVRMAFIRKMEWALEQIKEQVRKEG